MYKMKQREYIDLDVPTKRLGFILLKAMYLVKLYFNLRYLSME